MSWEPGDTISLGRDRELRVVDTRLDEGTDGEPVPTLVVEDTGPSGMAALRGAIETFRNSSDRASTTLIRLTWVLVGLTVVLVVATVLLLVFAG